jgi:hypothetical protein
MSLSMIHNWGLDWQAEVGANRYYNERACFAGI